jgi:copper homeostasis protein
MVKIEVVVYSLESAFATQSGGADRIELCDNLSEGGTTPSIGIINTVKQNLNIPVHIMIRPRGGDFLYSSHEFEAMKTDIEYCKKLKVDGVVFGILNADAGIDKNRCMELVMLAKPMSVTFHRAFDMCRNFSQALEDIIDCGFNRILTSGGKQNAIDGTDQIASLIGQAGNRIIIMPGGGVRKENILELYKKSGAKEFHVSARKNILSSMQYHNTEIKMGSSLSTDEYSAITTDSNMIREIKNLCEQC